MGDRIRPLFAQAVFPVVLGGALLAAHASLEAGLSGAAAAALAQVWAIVAVALSERLYPYVPDWNRPRGDIRTDAAHALISGLATPELLKPFLYAGAVVVAGAASRSFGAEGWPHAWPLPLQLALALVIGEFGQYWMHRCEHESEFFWRFHAVHHSAPRLYWLNAGRFHPIDLGLLFVMWYTPLIVLGCGDEVIVLFTVVNAAHGIFQHSNLEVRLGPLNWIFSMAELHRWHHSRTVAEANNNYGANLIVWDVVFGTRFLPQDRLPPTDIGIADMPNFPPGYWVQLATPFRWARLKRLASNERPVDSSAPNQ